MPTALLFPGQGSQGDDMRGLVDCYRPDLLDELDKLVSFDVFEHVHEGTIFQQPAIYCASLALYEALGRPQATAFAGHSLGEIAALTAAGVFSATDGVRVVVERGRLMERAGQVAPGGLLAVIGSQTDARDLAAECGLSVANDNAPDQVVLAGDPIHLETARERARLFDVRALRLPVGGAFHSRAMASATPEFADVLEAVQVCRPDVPVYSCTSGQPFRDVRRELVDALTRPVQWRGTLLSLHRSGVDTFVEIGPGRVLTGLVRRTLPGVTAYSEDGVLARV